MKKHPLKLASNNPGYFLGLITSFSVISIINIDSTRSSKGSQLMVNMVETEYKATSPVGNEGGIALPASCESGVFNSNSGYHLVAPYSDPGNCATPVYNCEAGSLNPGLGIVSDNTLIGWALNNTVRWYSNIWGGSGVGACFYNTSGTNYFVPTATQVERNAFQSNLPAGVTKGGF